MEKNKEGVKVGKYTLNLKEIGTGSYGTVFLAKDDKGKYYAVKRIDLSKLNRKTIKQKVIREIKLTYKLDNIHIVKMLDIIKTWVIQMLIKALYLIKEIKIIYFFQILVIIIIFFKIIIILFV